MKITVKESSNLSQTCPKVRASQTGISALRCKKECVVELSPGGKSEDRERMKKREEEGLEEPRWMRRRGRGVGERNVHRKDR
jgi:hypothetical protein